MPMGFVEVVGGGREWGLSFGKVVLERAFVQLFESLSTIVEFDSESE